MSNKRKSIQNKTQYTVKTKIKYSLIFLITFLSGCKTLEMTSYWRDRDIKIDGNSNDWQGKTWMVEDIKNVLFGFMNDENYLYLSLTISDRALQRQVAFGGLTVWFDRNGGEEKKFGIHYPLPMMMRDMPMERRQPRQDQDSECDTTWTFPEQFSNEIDIEGPMEGEHHRMALQETGGIETALHFSKGLLTYEMKVPLADKGPQPYVIGAAAGSIIGIGIETATGDFAGGRSSKPMMGGGPGGGGKGGRRGGGHGGGEPNFNRDEMRELLKLWAKVKLVTADSTSIR